MLGLNRISHVGRIRRTVAGSLSVLGRPAAAALEVHNISHPGSSNSIQPSQSTRSLSTLAITHFTHSSNSISEKNLTTISTKDTPGRTFGLDLVSWTSASLSTPSPWSIISKAWSNLEEAIWNISTLKRRRKKMNKHKLRKRRKLLARKTK